jgi:hypothetical protein
VPRVFQSIAAGVFGRAAFDGGFVTASIGVALHFAIATTWVGLYACALQMWPALRARVCTTRGRVQVGAIVGTIVWLTMNLAVVRASHARATPLFTTTWFILLVGHMVVVGQPMAWIVRPATR